MPRYIDADKIQYHRNCTGCSGLLCNSCEDYIAERYQIDEISTADVQEVKHGKWNWLTIDFKKCSICGTECFTIYADCFNYCPHCGARMDGDEK